MTPLVAWLLFPLLLYALCLGAGLLLQAASGRRLPSPLRAPAGFATIVVLAGFLTARGEIASLATPAIAVAASAGFVLGARARDWAVEGWALVAAVAVFAIYAAPVVLSGEPTFAGYVKLDDTATWMAFVDRVMEHGRDLSGLAPSSHRATLEVNLPQGYPVGAFLPLGIGSRLVGTDVAWLVQPYMATMAALLAMVLFWLARVLLPARELRALVAFGTAQSALLFGYSLWGGVKEVAVALGIALLAATAPLAIERGAGWRVVLPAAVATTALLTMVGSGGLVWVAPLLALAALALWRERGIAQLLSRAWPLLLAVLVLAVPVLFAAGVFSPTQGGLTDASELGNLLGPIDLAQYVGIWPSGDFRLQPDSAALTSLLIVLALAAAAYGGWLAWRCRAWDPLLFAAGAGIGSVAVYAYSSPWVGAKALASGSPSLLLLAFAGAAALAVRLRSGLGAAVLVLLLGGVLWSNALAYHDVWLAPYDQLRELEEIGEGWAGEGPTLLTEYQPYGARHFLREVDGEGASELRVRSVPLLGGGEPEKGTWVDTDEIATPALLAYRTLVLRRSPALSRPPTAYSLSGRGEYYTVWQRRRVAGGAPARLPLGDFYQPSAVPDCGKLQALATLAGDGAVLLAAPRTPNVVASLSASRHPPDWQSTATGSLDLLPRGPGRARLRLRVPVAGRYDVYVQGSVRNRLSVRVDGEDAGAVDYQINEQDQFLRFRRLHLAAGTHVVELELADQSLAPGSGGPPSPIGPVVLAPADALAATLVRLPASRARALCGRPLDWVEVLTPLSP